MSAYSPSRPYLPALAAALLWLLERVVAAGLAVMLALTVTNCVLRYLFDSGIAEAEEIAVLLLVWTTFLGSIAALARHEHLGIDFIPTRNRRVQTVASILSHLVMIAISVLLTWGSWVQFGVNLVNTLPVSGISQSILYAAGLVAGAAFTFILSVRLVGLVASLFRDVEPVTEPDAALTLGQESAS